ncbi:MAG TPA: 5-(carboxyamino)imidazole ribonucleotide mutase [Acidobacteriota bacterium]|jgi:phosphoribosylaminoimidazole carboxylase PurE protein|nr:5-(carboxyamino)imidazole ribonucleotide mutase [Acidobacteriota bacterium]
MSNYKIAIFMGSSSDADIMHDAVRFLNEMEVPHFVTVTSAHRSPARTRRLIAEMEQAGVQVFIVGAGGAAHLGGFVAAETTRPVIGVPLAASALAGWDALLATSQMPAGVPVATMAIGKAGAKNAAVLACQILALQDEKLADRMAEFKKKMEEEVAKSSAAVSNHRG